MGYVGRNLVDERSKFGDFADVTEKLLLKILALEFGCEPMPRVVQRNHFQFHVLNDDAEWSMKRHIPLALHLADLTERPTVFLRRLVFFASDANYHREKHFALRRIASKRMPDRPPYVLFVWRRES